MSEHLYFNELNTTLLNKKTRTWEVTATATDSVLGIVKFYGAWRKYVFFPSENMQTLYDASCLREIADFAESATGQWRESLKEKTG